MTTKKQEKNNSTAQRLSRYAVRKKTLNVLGLIFRYTILICIGFLIITPIYQTFKEGITEQSMLGFSNSAWVPPATSMQSFIEAYLILDYPKGLLFSIFNTLILAFLQTACAALAAYTFARLKFKGSSILFAIVIFSIIVPSQSIMLAQYISFKNFDIFGLIKLIKGEPLNLIGSTFSVYLLAATGMGVKGGLYIYILRQSYRQLPVSIEEAEYVDGAGFLKTFFHIVLPEVSASLLTVSVLSFVWNYSDRYLISLLMGNKARGLQLSLLLSDVQGRMRWAIQDLQSKMPATYVMNWESPLIQKGVLSACAFLVILPLIILYFFVQKKFIQGVERSGLGGD